MESIYFLSIYIYLVPYVRFGFLTLHYPVNLKLMDCINGVALACACGG